jgi:hypothetical protein
MAEVWGLRLALLLRLLSVLVAVERAGVHDVLLFRRNASRALFSFEETVVNGAIMVQPPLYYTIATRGNYRDRNGGRDHYW